MLWLSVVNLVCVSVAAVLLKVVSEDWWLSTAIMYLPRSPYVAGSLLLLPTAFFSRSGRGITLNVAALVLTAWPVMGLTVPFPSEQSVVANGESVRIVSCNVHGYQPVFASLTHEVAGLHPDIVVFQEAFQRHPLLESEFRDWHSLHFDEYFVASRYPIAHIASFRSDSCGRFAAAAFEVELPERRFRLINVHQTSPRHGLEALRAAGLLNRAGIHAVVKSARRREAEAVALRAFVEEHRGGLPLVLAGDFNMPSDSNVYRAVWGDLENAFDAAGFGFGYTFPCTTERFWPPGTPFMRIDHILASSDWQIDECRVGSGNGSDHRLITAVLCHAARVSAGASPQVIRPLP